MIIEEAIQWIHSRPRLPSKGSPMRMQALLDRLGHPERSLRFVHITGTNGKGSAAVMIGAILMESGKKTGMYTSPYICRYQERFQIDRQPIGDDELLNLIKKIQIVVSEMEKDHLPVTEFELGTALAFQYFADQQCDVVVLEVGIGGWHDATNVIPPPLVSVVMPVRLDHQALLGDTVQAVAHEKAGIIKGNPTVSYPVQEPEALAELMERCAQTGSPLIQPAASAITVVRSNLQGTLFQYGGETYEVSLIGEHQAYNGAVAVEVAKLLGIDTKVIKAGLYQAKLPARMEILRREPLVLLDGGHNQNALEALCRNVRQWELSDVTAVVGMMGDKDCQESIRQISQMAKRIRTVTVDDPRAATAEALARMASVYCADTAALGDASQAVQWILQQQTPVVICGSFYLAGEIHTHWKE